MESKTEESLRKWHVALIPNTKLSNAWLQSKNRTHDTSLVIREKGKSQNGCFKKTRHVKFFEKQTFLTLCYANVRGFVTQKCIHMNICFDAFENFLHNFIWGNSYFSRKIQLHCIFNHCFSFYTKNRAMELRKSSRSVMQ